MITRASSRTSRVERAANDLDLRICTALQNRDDVESAVLPADPGPLQILLGGQDDPALLLVGDRLAGRAEREPAAPLDLDETEDDALSRDEVDLAAARAEVALDDLVALGLQAPPRQPLPALAGAA